MRWLSISRVSAFVNLDCNARAIVSLPTPGKLFKMTKQPGGIGGWVDISWDTWCISQSVEPVLPERFPKD
jgi:hypothetical protein